MKKAFPTLWKAQKESVEFLFPGFLCLVLISCAGYTQYEYSDKLGHLYSFKMKRDVITDTSLVLDSEGNLTQLSVWRPNPIGLPVQKIIAEENKGLADSVGMRTKKQNSKHDSSLRSTEEIVSVIRANTPSLRPVYEKALRATPGFSGKVTFKFFLNKEGGIDYLYVVANTTGSKIFALELVNKMKYWAFTKSATYEEEIITVPFAFSQ